MNILMLNANLAGCGTYYRALWFARLCAENKRHNVTVATVSKNNKWQRNTYQENGVTITEGPNWGYHFVPGYGSNWLDIFWRYNQIRMQKYDLIYAFEYHPNVRWPITARSKDQLLLSDWCDWYAGSANKFKGSKLAHKWDKHNEEAIRFKAQRLSVISTQLEERALNIGLPQEKVHIIREGVDTNFMHPFKMENVRQKLGIAEDLQVVATMQDGAAFPHLVNAFVKVHQELPKTRLLFVGQPSSLQLDLIASKNLNDVFIATGRCSDEELPQFLSAANVFALPMENSLANEARFPHKIGDYLACGRALVVTNVGDYPSMLKQADAAIVSDSFDRFAADILSILKDPDKQNFYGQNGRNWVCRNLDWNIIKPDVLSFIESPTS